MKTLYSTLEGLLDADFDIKDGEVFTLKELGYKCTNMSANDNWGRGVSSAKCKELTGIETSQANRVGHNPFAKDFDDYVNTMVYHNKVSGGRDGLGMGKWYFAWIIRFVLDHCHENADEIEQFITNCMAEKLARSLEVNVKKMKNKFIIKSTFMGIWGRANMSMTLTKQ